MDFAQMMQRVLQWWAGVNLPQFLEFSQVVEWVLLLIIIPFIIKHYRSHKEQGLMIRRKLHENTGMMIFGEFDRQIQSEFLGDFLTALFGINMSDMISHWNDKPSPSIIIPTVEYQASHLNEIMAAKASTFILQSNWLEPYFASAKVYGSASYKFCRVIVALARPNAVDLSSHDYPRLIAIEETALRRITDNPATIRPQWDTKDGRTWLHVLRELGEHVEGDQKGYEVLEVPMNGILAMLANEVPSSS